ncbi:MAG: flagellar motor switch protein FliN [Methylocystaceae bacterium]|nr:flagellar motor switch protein FliN [Methylocystaceae bacterium]
MTNEPMNLLLSSMSEGQKLARIENIEASLKVEVGTANITIRDLLKLNVGSVIELDRLAGEHLDIRVNGTLILKGEVVAIAETLGVRVTDVVSHDERSRDNR